MRFDKNAGKEDLLFQAVDDFFTVYTLPCTVNGCLTMLAVRGFPASEDLSEDELIPLFVEKLLWFEHVDGTERRKKRLPLNRPVKPGPRVQMKRKTSLRALEKS